MTRATPHAIVVRMHGRRVLLVDADPMQRLTIDRQLELLGWDALLLNRGSEAIRALEMGFAADVLLADVQLPDMDGAVVAWMVGRVSPHMRVAFMGRAWPQRPLEPHHAPFALKPFSIPTLDRVMRCAVPTRSVVAPDA